MLTYSQRKTFARQGAASIEAEVRAAVSAVAAQEAANRAVAKAAYENRHAAVPFTAEELDAATHVRTIVGWHEVMRVNAKSVSVKTPYSWTDRHDIGKILECRNIA